jgi:hypothetical protein
MIGATSSNSTDTIVAVFRELIVAATRSGRRFELLFRTAEAADFVPSGSGGDRFDERA